MPLPHLPAAPRAPLNRQALLARLTAHGWQHQLMFAGCGPVYVVRVPGMRGFIEMPVPPHPEDDHGLALDHIYALAMKLFEMSDVKGSA